MPRRCCLRAILAVWLVVFVATIGSFAASPALALGSAERTQKTSPLKALVSQYCADCHSQELKKGDLDLETLCATGIASSPDAWEKVARKLRTRQMPPPGKPRPDEATYQGILADLDATLDDFWTKHPNPGRTETLRRLNRTEYQNAIRDLLDLEIDAATLLPREDSGHGFDNVTVGNLSPTLLDRYITAAQKISRLAVGTPGRSGGETFRIQPDITQEEHVRVYRPARAAARRSPTRSRRMPNTRFKS